MTPTLILMILLGSAIVVAVAAVMVRPDEPGAIASSSSTGTWRV